MDWLTPETADEMARLLRERGDRERALPVTGAAEPPRDLPAGAPSPGAVVSTARVSGVVDHRPRDLTVSVEAGTRVTDLLERLSDEGAWLPFGGPTLEMSVGGAVACALPGPFDAGHGDVRRQLLACEVVTWRGERTRWGRGVMKNVAGYGTIRAVAGSFGRLGVIHRATFRVWPAPDTRRSLRLVPAAGDALATADRIARSGFDADVRPDAVLWRRSPEEERLEVRLAGRPEAVELRLERLRSWARGAGVRPGAVSVPPSFREEADAGAAGPFGRRPRGRGSAAWVAAGRRRFARAARAAGEALGDALVSLQGYPLTGDLRCAWRRPLGRTGPADDGPPAEGPPSGPDETPGGVRSSDPAPAVERLLDALGGTPVRMERGTERELAAVDRRRADRVRRLEERVVGAFGGRARHWLSGYL